MKIKISINSEQPELDDTQSTTPKEKEPIEVVVEHHRVGKNSKIKKRKFSKKL
jgi:hypothetical protein